MAWETNFDRRSPKLQFTDNKSQTTGSAGVVESLESSRMNDIKNALRLTALIMAQGLVSAAAAQSTNAVASTNSLSGKPLQMPEVVVTGTGEGAPAGTVASPKFTEPLRDTPQTITVVSQAVIQEQGATSLRDVLRNVPGISLQAGEGGTPAGDQLAVRGFSARTDLFIDGVRDFGGYSRDPFNFEQVEVAKGPASTISGRGSTGGAINMVSKTPHLDTFYDGSVGFGTDDYKRTTVDFNQSLAAAGLETAAVRVNALWHDADTPGRDEINESRWGVAPSIAFGLGTPTRLTLSYFHLQQDNLPGYGIPWVPANTGPLALYSNQPAPVDYANFYGLTARDYEKIQTDLATVQLDHDFGDSLRVRNLTRWGQTYRDSIITAPRFMDANTSTAISRSDWKSRDQTDEIVANQTDVTWEFDTGPVKHTVVTGGEYDYEHEINYARVATGSSSPATDLYNPTPGDPYLENIRRNGAYAESTANSVALYAFDTLKLGEKWELTGGLRYDHFDLDYRSVATNGVATPLGRKDDMVSWRGALVFKPVERGSIYFGYGTSFNPAAEGLTLSTSATSSANVTADPEQSQTFELGTKWDLLDERLSLSAALFRTEKTNARTPDPIDPSIVTLTGEQVVNGVELSISGRITPNWEVFGGYTYMQSEITKSNTAGEQGNELSNTPENSFSLWTTYKLPGGIQIGGGANYVDSRYSNTANTRQAPDYWLFNATAAYEVNKHVTLRLNVYNLADTDYIDQVGGGHFIPGAGRSAVLSANFKF